MKKKVTIEIIIDLILIGLLIGFNVHMIKVKNILDNVKENIELVEIQDTI